jgi:hypothetical protein
MQMVATILGIASGFALIGYHEGPDRMIATSLAVDVSLAPLTAVIASRRGRSALLWVILGFALGIWALAYVLLLTARGGRPSDSHFPPTSDAA